MRQKEPTGSSPIQYPLGTVHSFSDIIRQIVESGGDGTENKKISPL